VIIDVILFWFQTFSIDFDVSVFIWHPLYHNISSFSIFMCLRVYMMLLLLSILKNVKILKKMNNLCIF
jgi:hypothetical protein